MTSERPASGKRATPPRACDYTKAFRKDWERLPRSGRYDLYRPRQAMLLPIAGDGPLGPEWLDHPLFPSSAGTSVSSCERPEEPAQVTSTYAVEKIDLDYFGRRDRRRSQRRGKS